MEKAVEDTVSLKKFFLSNINAYKWSKRVDATIYRCNNLKTAKEVRKHIYKKNRGLLNDDDILKRINDDNPLRLTIVSKKFEKNDNEFIDNIDWNIGISKDIILNDGTYILIDIKEVIPTCNKELFECRGNVISDFQNYLELEWLESLKLKYSIAINYELLYSLIK